MNEAVFLPARHRISVGDYYRMVEAGIYNKYDRIELIEGDIVDMAPIGQGHAAFVSGLTEAVFVACMGKVTVWPQNSLRLSDWSAPEPDVAVLRRRADFYATGERPNPADVLLLIEVADSSLAYDRTVKLALYARAGIAEYWIVDVKGRVVEAHRRPAGDRYGETTTHRAGDRIALAVAPEIVVTIPPMFG